MRRYEPTDPRMIGWDYRRAPYPTEVLVVPVSAIQNGRRPHLGDVIKLAGFQWDEMKRTGQSKDYKRCQLHTLPYQYRSHPVPMGGSDSGRSGVVDIYVG